MSISAINLTADRGSFGSRAARHAFKLGQRAAEALRRYRQERQLIEELRSLDERQRRDMGLPVDLDGPYSEIFHNIGWCFIN